MKVDLLCDVSISYQLITLSSHCGSLQNKLDVCCHTLEDKQAQIVMQHNQIQVILELFPYRKKSMKPSTGVLRYIKIFVNLVHFEMT